MSAPTLSLAPMDGQSPTDPDQPPPPLDGKPLEDAARAELRKMLHLDVSVNAPTWRQVLFSAKRIKFQAPKAPDQSIKILGQIKPPDGVAQDHVGVTAVGLGEQLQKAKPEGMVPQSVTALPALPVSRDATSAWLRQVFLVTAGPEALRLLVAAGFLLPSDLAILEGVYPDGVDEERKAVVEAGMAVASSGTRTGHSTELPGWLNAQLLMLMGEPNDAGDYQDLYKQQSQNAPGGGGLGGKPGKIAQQAAPDTIKGSL